MPETVCTAPTKSTETKTLLEVTSQPSRPGGKLVERLGTKEGATLVDLTELTGWQPHTVRAGLTRPSPATRQDPPRSQERT